MMIRRHHMALMWVLLCLAGCAPYTKDIKVRTEIGNNTDLSFYNTYTWKEIISTLNDPRGQWQPLGFDVEGDIKLLIDRELHNRGLQQSNRQAELAVFFQVGANMQALKLKRNPRTEQDVLVNTPDANLMIILSETATGNIIWISKASARIQDNLNVIQVRQRLDYTITEMFKGLDNQSWF